MSRREEVLEEATRRAREAIEAALDEMPQYVTRVVVHRPPDGANLAIAPIDVTITFEPPTREGS